MGADRSFATMASPRVVIVTPVNPANTSFRGSPEISIFFPTYRTASSIPIPCGARERPAVSTDSLGLEVSMISGIRNVIPIIPKLLMNTMRVVALKDVIFSSVSSKPTLLVEDFARLKKANSRQTATIPNTKVGTEKSDEDTRVRNSSMTVMAGMSMRIDQ